MRPQGPLDLAVQHFRAGRLNEALSICERLRAAEPRNVTVLHLLAATTFRLGDPAAGAAMMAEAIGLDPSNAEAHKNLGLMLRDQGRHEEAAASYRRAIALQPSYADAHFHLGVALRELGRLEEAAASYRRAIALKPDFAAAHANLGHVLAQLDRVEEAVACFRRALEARPGEPDFLVDLGKTLARLGRHEEAAACYRRALEIRPDFAPAHFWLAPRVRYRPGDAAFATLERVLAGGGMAPGEEATARFALGKMYADIGDYDRSFAHYRDANRLEERLQESMGMAFDPAERRRYVARLRDTFDTEFFARRRGFGIADRHPVLIVGMPRTGKSLVGQALAGHSAVSFQDEKTFLGDLMRAISEALAGEPPYPWCLAEFDAATARRWGEWYRDAIATRSEASQTLVSSYAGGTVQLALLTLICPGVRVVYCRRDPRDTVLACYFKSFVRARYAFSTDLVLCARFLRLYEALMEHWRQVLPLAMLDVWYEELVSDPAAVIPRIVEFCGLAWEDACLEGVLAATSADTLGLADSSSIPTRLDATRIGAWRHYEAHLGPMLGALSEDD